MKLIKSINSVIISTCTIRCERSLESMILLKVSPTIAIRMLKKATLVIIIAIKKYNQMSVQNLLSTMFSVGILPIPSRNCYMKEFIRLFPLTSVRKLVYESGVSSFS